MQEHTMKNYEQLLLFGTARISYG